MTAARRDTTMNPVKLILNQWPTATDIRQVIGHCPICNGGLFYSFVLLEYAGTYVSKLDGAQMENCGYKCCLCGWSNAGSRPVESEDAK